MPFYNERNNLERLLEDLDREAGSIDGDFLFFDDGSTDGSSQIIIAKKLTLLRSETTGGYGNSVKQISRFATTKDYDYFAVFPGDYQRSFFDLKRLLGAREGVDFVITSKLRNSDIPIVRRLEIIF